MLRSLIAGSFTAPVSPSAVVTLPKLAWCRVLSTALLVTPLCAPPAIRLVRTAFLAISSRLSSFRADSVPSCIIRARREEKPANAISARLSSATYIFMSVVLNIMFAPVLGLNKSRSFFAEILSFWICASIALSAAAKSPVTLRSISTRFLTMTRSLAGRSPHCFGFLPFIFVETFYHFVSLS